MNSHFAALAKKEASIDSSEEPPGRSRSATEQPPLPKQPKPLLAGITAGLRRLFPAREDTTLKEAIEEMLEDHEPVEGEIPSEERMILENVLAFGDLTVNDITIPRSDILAIPCDMPLPEIIQFFAEHRHTRVPVYKENLDQIQGFLHIKDIFSIVADGTHFSMHDLLRPMLFVPPSMPVADVLVKMRKLSSHMAIVVDEYGGTDGLVTLEDVFEEIVGDIQDEHDEEEERSDIVRVSAHVADVDARILIETLEAELNVSLGPADESEYTDYETLGGWVFSEIGRVPKNGEIIKHPSGVECEILEADARRIIRIRMHHLP